MCLAVRARMLLFAASPLVNGNEWYAGFKNYDGKFRFSQTYDPAKWKRAADANRELIEAAHAAGHDLVREYNADGSIDPFMSCYNVFFLRGDQNPEALFIRSDCNFSEFEKHATPRGASGNGGLGVYQTLVDAFAMKDGSLPITGYDGNYGKPIINKESGYTERGFLRKRISVKLSTIFTVIVRELQSTRLVQMVAPIIKWLPPALTICMSVVNLVSI